MANESERLGWREKLGEVLCEKSLYVTEVMNKHEFVPKMPNISDLELVFNTSFHDVHSHLWVVSVGVNSVRKLLKDTLVYLGFKSI